jgi:hypothetical protein
MLKALDTEIKLITCLILIGTIGSSVLVRVQGDGVEGTEGNYRVTGTADEPYAMNKCPNYFTQLTNPYQYQTWVEGRS